MKGTRGLLISGSLFAILLAGAAPAQAELYKDVARGLALLDFQFSGQRNVLGDGITVNANAFYNNRQFDFGVGELTLTGQVRASAGFTRRGIPGADFTLNTGSVPLNYTFRTTNGLADITATGSVLINIDTDINALGFYNQRLQISNRGTFETTGAALGGGDSGTLAFDVGPIDVSGNIFADILTGLTQPFFAATGTENPFEKFSAQAKLMKSTRTVEELQARLAAGDVLSDEELSALINNSIVAAILGGEPSSNLFDQFMLPDGLIDSKTGETNARMTVAPEPATFSALALALVAGLMRRRPVR
ncbi:MAG TPA: hypothetical protein PKG54_10840 [Phycisphaerae bacterium]|nr:hypothetical protein [Phycisphaerae bacterium]HQA43246.1 hypothetical protein [Phycisphaerae bacterium]HQE42386.1 hypothetical protein [Phycisphaerae bacterium]